MEKSRHGAFVYAQKVLKHSLFLFLLINLLSISPDISASTTLLEQKYTLNLSFKDARLEQVLDAIMKQSGVKIAYSSDELQKDRVVSVDIQTSDILTALRSVLGDGYSFKQIEDYIAIARKEISDVSDIVSNIADDRTCPCIVQFLSSAILLTIEIGLYKDRFLKIQNLHILYQV